jgi:methyl-accepting chemotaxis protein
MNRFQDLSIKWELLLVILLITTAIVLLTCAAFVAHEVHASRQAIIRDLTVLADVFARNSTAALQFEDERAAAANLGALTAEPHIVAACLYKGDGARFATYARRGEQPHIPDTPEGDGHRLEADRAVVCEPVVMDGKRIGTIYLHADLQAIRDRFRAYLVIAGWILLAAAAATIVISLRLQRLISRPILALAHIARVIREQRNYSVRAAVQGRNEIGLLTESFNQMLSDIEASQAALRDANQSLQAQTVQIRESVGVLGAAARDILAITTQVTATATETATAVGQTTATVQTVRRTAGLSSQKAGVVADNAQTTVQVSQDGKQATEEVVAGMQRIRQQMESIADSMVRLSEQTQAIGQIIASVDDLAAQSNLLAVNAAIEAAKAGEQGKGFAVVAQEVRTLAEQSKQATNQVRTILHDIQKATGAAVMASEQGSKAVEAGVRQSAQAGESILALSTSVTEAADAARQIAATSQQQMAGVDQVATAMESIKQASAQNVASARQLETAARNLNDQGQKLKQLVERDKPGEPQPA